MYIKLTNTSKIFNSKAVKERRKILRNDMPMAEVKLWSEIKGKQINNRKFRRQYSIGKYIIDFYCPELKLAIEIDGDTHITEKQIKYDKERQKIIESMGIKFLRFTNGDIYDGMEYVLETIHNATI